jgi:serine/threonine protein phosphatase 1
MMSRTIAIGDIHGCSDALSSVLRAIDPQPNDTIITLGDYVNRGIDSKGALDLLIELSGRFRLVPILGNHDEMMLKANGSRSSFRHWMEFGGIETLDSYGDTGHISLVPRQHFDFLESCVAYFENETHFFTHGNYDPDLPLDQQDERTLRRLSLRDFVPGPHVSGKIAVVGHTPQTEVLDLGHLICVDTGCAYGGKLTAMELESGEVWQAGTMQ